MFCNKAGKLTVFALWYFCINVIVIGLHPAYVIYFLHCLQQLAHRHYSQQYESVEHQYGQVTK